MRDMDEDHWTVCTKSKPHRIPPSIAYPNGFDATGTEFRGPFLSYAAAEEWALENGVEEYEIRFQDMSAYRK